MNFKKFVLFLIAIALITMTFQGCTAKQQTAAEWEKLPTFVSPVSDKAEPMQTGKFHLPSLPGEKTQFIAQKQSI